MPSPFPGMDPYLEAEGFWEDFHLNFNPRWRRALDDVLPFPYEASVTATTNLIEVTAEGRKLIKPDVAVLRDRFSETKPWESGGIATIKPIIRSLPVYEEVRESWIEIVHRPRHQLVAVLELLSPWNKALNVGRDEYLAKRTKIIRQPVHLIELDLLLDGSRLPMADGLPAGDYYALVSRADRRPKSDVFAWSLRDGLPQIAVPLLSPDPDVLVDLGAVFASAYEMGGYGRRLDYTTPPSVPIPEIHRNWVTELANSAKPG